MSNSKIEWTDATWNPVVGCSIVSKGCDHCYAMRHAYRLEHMHQEKYKGLTRKTDSGRIVWTGKISIDEKALLEPLSRKKPTMYFVDSMGDLFHEGVPFEFIDKVFAVMALTPQHTYQVLTKRPERMAEYFLGHDLRKILVNYIRERLTTREGIEGKHWDTIRSFFTPEQTENIRAKAKWEEVSWIGVVNDWGLWPDAPSPILPNVWLGTSVEDQKTADERIPHLLKVPAMVRFLSCEPLLGPVDLTRFKINGGDAFRNALTGTQIVGPPDFIELDNLPKIHWVIAGGESGPGARPMHPDWVRSLRDQCQAAGVAFFFKQWGAWRPSKRNSWEGGIKKVVITPMGATMKVDPGVRCEMPRWITMENVGKKAAGNVLDGVQHLEFPGV